ncbi:ATP-binding protein [Amycolatopsis deserti]|uniref:ATP-binding protein n=1 Tax=Amycolatopsis deserti TaxID=185696 RepID=UPI00174B0ACF|nr:LuxR C-terminal-related transcriptional regulator [Amycolatopsis deserti]
MTSFVGRRAEAAQLRRALESHRAVTLTGTGGVGKTRLALRVAAETRRAFDDGVWFVELDDVSDGALLASTVLGGLGLRDDGGRTAQAQLLDHFRGSRALLLLDGCDRVVDACAGLVATLLQAAPDLRVLGTSRRPLHIAGEAVLPVGPLPVPAESDSTASALARCDAVALFADRVAAIRPGFALTDANAPAVARICRQLDGLPMAIEFAADRLDVLALDHLAERLDDAYRLLVTGKRTAPERQRTLRALVESSYTLCTADEQVLWSRLAAFTGRFELDAIEEVCVGGAITEESVLGLVTGLVDKSVLNRDEHRSGSWYRLPRLLREYARGELLAEPDWTELRERHAHWCLRLAERSADGLLSPKADYWVGRVRGNHANIRAALEFCLEDASRQTCALRLASALWHYWIMAGRVEEGRAWLERALRTGGHETVERAMALAAAAYLAVIDGDDRAGALLEEGLAIERRLADPALSGNLYFVAGLAEVQRDDLAAARAHLEDALAQWRRTDDVMGVSRTLALLALVCVLGEDTAKAVAYAEEFVRDADGPGDNWGLAYIHGIFALAALGDGDLARALDEQRRAAALAQRYEDEFGMVWCVQSGALILAAAGRPEEAAQLLGTAEDHRGFTVVPMSELRRACAKAVRSEIGDRRFAELERQGRGMTLAQAVNLVLDRPAQETGDRETPDDTGLSKREWEVAALIAEGRSNKEIAAALVISTRTAEGHVRGILAKLGLVSRAQVAAWMTERRALARPDSR